MTIGYIKVANNGDTYFLTQEQVKGHENLWANHKAGDEVPYNIIKGQDEPRVISKYALRHLNPIRIYDDGSVYDYSGYSERRITPERHAELLAEAWATWHADAPRRDRAALRKNKEANKPRKNPRFIGPDREAQRELLADVVAAGTPTLE